MIKFEIKDRNGYFYDYSLYKKVQKRNGDIVEELGQTCYGVPLYWIKYILSNMDAQDKLEDGDVSLKEYLVEFNKSYKELCELLKKIL